MKKVYRVLFYDACQKEEGTQSVLFEAKNKKAADKFVQDFRGQEDDDVDILELQQLKMMPTWKTKKLYGKTKGKKYGGQITDVKEETDI